MYLAIMAVAVGIMFFVAIVNLYYISGESKNKTKEELRKRNIFNSSTAWLIYSIILGIAMFIILYIAYTTLIGGFINIGNSQNQAV